MAKQTESTKPESVNPESTQHASTQESQGGLYHINPRLVGSDQVKFKDRTFIKGHPVSLSEKDAERYLKFKVRGIQAIVKKGE